MSIGPLQSLIVSIASLAILASVKVACTDDARPPSNPTQHQVAPSKASMPSMDGDVPPGLQAFDGTVKQQLKAGHYRYLDLSVADGRRVWVATMGAGAPVGSSVAVRAYSAAHDFQSRRLKRRFDQLLFGQVSPKATP